MKIAITGGSGFIGTRLIEDLRVDGHEIVIVDIAHEQPVDILHQDKLNAAVAGCDVIYHLAAAHRDDIFPRSLYYEVNGQGTRNVITAAEVNKIRHIIFTSTVAVYGLSGGAPDENQEPAPFNDYGKSKLEAEKSLKEWADKSIKNTATILRPVVVFGEKNRGNVHTLIRQIASGKFMMIGKGHNKKSMAYVGNVSGFLKHCLKEKKGVQVYNYSDKPDFTTKELTSVIYNALYKEESNIFIPYSMGVSAGYMFDLVARVTGRKFPISAVRVKKFCADTTVTAEKYLTTGYKPNYSLSDGVERMIQCDFSSDNQQEKAKCHNVFQ